MNTNRTFWLA